MLAAGGLVYLGLMPRARLAQVDLEWESFGHPDDPAVLLVMGLGAQGIYWPDGFVARLVARGLRVVRYDNRDCGRSTRLSHLRPPSMLRLAAGVLLRRPARPPYPLEAMADDAVQLLDALGVERCHLVGASMGGMIGQLVALRNRARLLSLTSIMSSTGDPVWPKPRALKALMARAVPGADGAVARSLTIFRTLAGTELPFDEEGCTALARLAYERAGFDPDGFKRQLAAIFAAPSRTAALSSLEGLPTLVLHGSCDPLVPPRAGRATAAAIPGARFELVQGMGHHLPTARWPELVDAIATHVHAAEPATAAV